MGTVAIIDLNKINAGAIIIAGSGMCTGGRIRHHFKHNLWKRNAHVVIVGYQAIGTPGRALVDGAKTFRLGNDEIIVNAAIHTLGGFSAHASQSQLIDWISYFEQPRPSLYLIHGEEGAKKVLADRLSDEGWLANIPHSGESVSF